MGELLHDSLQQVVVLVRRQISIGLKGRGRGEQLAGGLAPSQAYLLAKRAGIFAQDVYRT